MTLTEVLRLYQAQGCAEKSLKTLRTDASGLRAVGEALGNYRVDTKAAQNTLRGVDVSRYREARKAAGVSPVTIARELAVASAACRWAISEMDLDIVNPFAGRIISKADRKAIKPSDRVPTPMEVAALILAADAPMQDIIAFAAETGMRRDEIRLLTPERITGAIVVFRPEHQKSGRHGVCALSVIAQGIVARQPLGAFVFHEDASHPLSVNRWDYLWDKARKRAKVDCPFHSLRHFAAVRMRETGVTLEDIAAQLRHESTNITARIYARAGIESVLRAVK